jgi:Rps23 Pro-64 3,4-dihydroxylase Tpa1-like proline 4-hydroxylase
MAALRTDLAYNLNRPHMNQGDAVHKYGAGSTEISYTRFGPGAFLKRHTDEHHEEIKGLAGWSQPTRRSVSWLVYLNDRVDWNPAKDGGQLRCFARKTGRVHVHTNDGLGLGVGARPMEICRWVATSSSL